MLSFESEIEALRPRIGDRAANALLARERREVFSVQPEVRVAAWAGAVLLATAAGIFVTKHFAQFDRRAVAVALAVLALGCYAWSWPRRATTVAAYVVLLGALLVSADVAFLEVQFDLFGDAPQRHLLVLAFLHGVTAYVFGSRLVLSLSIASLAAWMGLERRAAFDFDAGLAARAFACSGVVLVWRALNRRADFARVFEHFAANLALWGGVTLVDRQPSLAALLTTAVGALVIAWGFRVKVESFVLYAFVYLLVADTAAVMSWTGKDVSIVLLAIVVAVPALFALHGRFQKRGEA